MSTLNKVTQSLHAGHDVTITQGTRSVPIYQNTAYVFNNSDHAADLFSLKELGYIYIYIYNDEYQINRLLQDIDLALNEQFSQIENNDYAEDYAGEYTIWGEIMEGLDFELFDELS